MGENKSFIDLRKNGVTEVALQELLKQYRSKVESAMYRARYGKGDTQFSNDGVQNAKIVIDVMLNSAVDDVKIFTEMLHSEVFSVDQIKKLVASGITIKIIAEKSSAIDSKDSALSGLKSEIQDGKIEIRFLETESKEQLGHFCLVDDDYLRYELNHDARNAFVSFGKKKINDLSKDLFDSYWTVAKAPTYSEQTK